MKNYKSVFLVAVAAIAMVIISGCGGAKLSPKHSDAIAAKKTMFTQVGMWFDSTKKNAVWGTNYNVGIYLPANSEVVLEAATKNGIIFKHKSRAIILRNDKYTGLDANKFLDRQLGEKPVSLSKFSAAEKKAIAKGLVEKGMSKDAVIISRGFPPAHVTPTLDLDRWTFWKNRWVKMHVDFENGKVKELIQ